MPPVFEVASYQTDLASIVEDVFRTMLNVEVEPLPDGEFDAVDCLTAAVYFVGEWKGAVLLQMSPELARSWCTVLLRAKSGPISEDDVRDASGELANMVAGNLKSVLPPGVALSIPSVTLGGDAALRICGRNLTNKSRFCTPSGVFLVTLVEVIEK